MNRNWIVSRNENKFFHHYYVNRSDEKHSSQLVESRTKEMIRRWITIIRSPAVSGSVSRADCVKHVMTTAARSATRVLWCRSSAAVATGHRLLLSASGPGRVLLLYTRNFGLLFSRESLFRFERKRRLMSRKFLNRWQTMSKNHFFDFLAAGKGWVSERSSLPFWAKSSFGINILVYPHSVTNSENLFFDFLPGSKWTSSTENLYFTWNIVYRVDQGSIHSHPSVCYIWHTRQSSLQHYFLILTIKSPGVSR